MVISNRTPKNGIKSIFIIIGAGFIVGGMTAWFITYLHQLDLASSSLILMILFLLMSGMGMVMALSSGDLLAPQYLLPSIYLFAFGIGSYLLNIGVVNLGTEGFPITLTQWSYYILGVVAFLIGFICSVITFSNNHVSNPSKIRWDFSRLIIVIITLGLIGTIARYLVFFRTGIPILNQNLDVLRSAQRDVGGVIGTLTWFSNISIHLGSYFLLQARVKKYIKLTVGLFILSMVGTMLLSGGRQQVAIAVIAYVIMYHYTIKKLGFKELFVFVFLAFVFIGGLGAYRIYARYGQEYLSFLKSQGIPLWLSWLPEISKQISMGSDGLAFVLQTIPVRVDYRYGWVALSPLLHFLPGRQLLLDDWIKEISGGKWVGFGRPVSMLGGFYADGGPLGIVIGMFLIGFLIYVVHNNLRTNNSPVWLLLYALWMTRLISAWRGSLSAPYEIVIGPAVLILTHLFVQKESYSISEIDPETEPLLSFERNVKNG